MYYFLLSHIAIKPITPRAIIPSVSGIQSGLVTHHQLQFILPVSLSIKNTINSTDPRPRPLDDVLFAIILLLMLLLMLLLVRCKMLGVTPRM